MIARPIALLTMILIVGSVRADSVTIDLGGARQARAEISSTDMHVTIRLTMRPVEAFDTATNAEVNAEVARELALRALARHLAGGKDVVVQIAGETTLQSALKGGRYEHVLRLPRDGARALRADESATGGRLLKPGAFQGRLFTAKQEYLDTLAALTSVAEGLLRSAQRDAEKSPAAQRADSLARAFAQAEARITVDFDRLLKSVLADDLLTDNTEKPELREAIAIERSRLAARAKRMIVADEVLRKFKDADLSAPFDEYLTTEPLIMEVGGAVIAELGPDRRALIGVAKVVLRDESPATIVSAEKVCRIKAKAALVAERDGSEITYLKQVKDRIEVVKNGTEERGTSVTELTRISRERLQGVVKNAPVVGRWRSADGKLLYLAVGSIVDGRGEPIR